MKKATIIVVAVTCLVGAFLAGACFAQPDIVWQKSLGGSDGDWARFIQQTSDGGFIVAGYSKSNDGDVSGNHGGVDYWVVKVNSAGDIVWQKFLGGSSDDYANSVQQTADSGFIVAGYSKSNDGDVSGHHGSTDYYDYWVVKLDSSGDIEWQKSLGGSDWDWAYSIDQTADGGFIVAGYSKSNDGDVSGNHGSYDYWVVKLNSAGDIEWQKSLGGSSSDWAHSIQQTSDGGFIVAGYSKSNDGDVSGHHGSTHPDSLTYDYWVVKLNSAGDIVWQKSLGGSSSDLTHSIQQTSDGGFIVAGYSKSNDGDVSGHHGSTHPDSLTYDYWVVKLDSVGEIVWQKSLGGSDWDWAFSIDQTADGGFIVAGSSKSNDGDVSGHHGSTHPDSLTYDYWVVKLNSVGEIVWQKSLGGSDEDHARSIQQTADGGFIVVGFSESNDGDVSGNHGSTHPDSLTYDYWVVKLSPDDGIAEGRGERPFALAIGAYPNPFNSSVAIAAPAGAEMEIYDVNGRMIYAPSPSVPLPKGEGGQVLLPPGEGGSESRMRAFIWQPDESVTSGVYLVRATAGEKSITKRIVYLK